LIEVVGCRLLLYIPLCAIETPDWICGQLVQNAYTCFRKKLASKSESNVLKEGISSGMLLGGLHLYVPPFVAKRPI
jgi:hypothetical protein